MFKPIKKTKNGIKKFGNKIADVLLRMKSKSVEEGDIAALKDTVDANPEDLTKDTEYEGESDVTPLHLAVLTNASPEVIECLIEVDEATFDAMTSTNRTALDIAKELVKDKECTEDSSRDVKNAFAAVEILEITKISLAKRKELTETVKMTDEYLAQIENELSVVKEFDGKAMWRKLKTAVIFANNLLANHSSLGPKIDKDSLPAVCPSGFKIPPNLERDTVDIVLPVGFNRLRCALLDKGSEFMEKNYYEERLQNTEIKVGGWDKLDDYIGKHDLPKDISEEEFIGAERKYQYKMPKTMLVGANTAYGNARIIEHNDYCFALKKVTTNPEVPYGKTFEAHTQWVFVNNGNYHCRMICSMETVFPEKKPMFAWKIKNGMFSGCSDADVALGEMACAHARNE